MPMVELSDDQVVKLIEQLPDDQKRRVLDRLAAPEARRPKPRFGSARNDIIAMAPDFDAPLEDFKGYM